MKDWAFVQPPRAAAATSITNPGFQIPTTSAQNLPYDAGHFGSRRLRTWRPPNSGPNTSIARDVITIRARSRAAARNDPWAGAAQDRSAWNGIGVGIQGWMVNGTDEQREFIAELWRLFTEQCDADNCLDFYGMQGLAWTEWGEGGEVFGRLRPRRRGDGLAVPLQVQLLEAEMCPNDLFSMTSNGNRVRYGIEFDRIMRRAAYWLYQEHPGDLAFGTAVSRQYSRVPADQVVHLYRPIRAGQHRGIPDAVSVLLKMFSRDSMDDAVLERQKIVNLFAGFLEQTETPEPNTGVIDEWAKGVDGDESDVETDADDIAMVGLEPGTMTELPPGYKANFSQPPAPGTEYSEYMRGHLLAIAARHGVPYEVLTGDLREIGDRALRLILNEFRRGLEMKQWLYFIPKFCQPIRAAFFEAAYLDGQLDELFPDYAERRAFYQRTLWVPQGWPYSHPVQDVDADRKAMRAGLASPISKILSTGENPDQVLREWAQFAERIDDLGLVFDSDPRRVDGTGKSQQAKDPANPEDTPPPASNNPDDPNDDPDADPEDPEDDS